MQTLADRRGRARAARARDRRRDARSRSAALSLLLSPVPAAVVGVVVYALRDLRAALARAERGVDVRAGAALSAQRAIVTGIGGQDGSYLAELLLERGYDVVGIVRTRRRRVREPRRRARPRRAASQADLLDEDALARVLREHAPREVYNLASPSFVPISWEQPVVTAEFAAVGVTSLLEAIRAVDSGDPRSTRRRRARSSASRRRCRRPRRRRSRPVTPYGVAKAYGHFIIRSYRRRYGLHASCGILYNHESPRRPVDFLPSKVAHAAAAISLGLERELLARRPRRAARLGLRRRLRRGDVADAPAGRAGRLRDRDAASLHSVRGARRARVRARRARLARARPGRRRRSCAGQAELHHLVGDASQARDASSAGSRRSASRSSSGCSSMRPASGSAAHEFVTRRPYDSRRNV